MMTGLTTVECGGLKSDQLSPFLLQQPSTFTPVSLVILFCWAILHFLGVITSQMLSMLWQSILKLYLMDEWQLITSGIS